MTKEGKKPTLFLIDGSNYIYRAFYAIRELSNSKGFPTNAPLIDSSTGTAFFFTVEMYP